MSSKEGLVQPGPFFKNHHFEPLFDNIVGPGVDPTPKFKSINFRVFDAVKFMCVMSFTLAFKENPELTLEGNK